MAGVGLAFKGTVMKGTWIFCFLTLPLLNGCLLGGTSVFEPGPPEIEYWIKPGTSAEQRVQDSIDCKGNVVGLPVESQANLEAAMLPGEEDIKLARRRLFNNWQRCMLGKGYQYIGECYPNEISRSRPACGGP